MSARDRLPRDVASALVVGYLLPPILAKLAFRQADFLERAAKCGIPEWRAMEILSEEALKASRSLAMTAEQVFRAAEVRVAEEPMA